MQGPPPHSRVGLQATWDARGSCCCKTFKTPACHRLALGDWAACGVRSSRLMHAVAHAHAHTHTHKHT